MDAVIPFPREEGQPTHFPVRYEHKGAWYVINIPAGSWLETVSHIKSIKRTIKIHLQ